MDTDPQLVRRLDWLDEQTRKDRAELAQVQERLAAAQNDLAAQTARVQELETTLSSAHIVLARAAKLDEILDGLRAETVRQLDAAAARRQEAEREADKRWQGEREGLNRALVELRKGLDAAHHLSEDMAARKEEERRVNKILLDVGKRLDDFGKQSDERGRSVSVLEEGRRQDAKRIADIQAEAASLRKQMDEHKGKLEALEDRAGRGDARLTELLAAEAERRTLQASWMEQQAVAQAVRDREWREFQETAEKLKQNAEDYARRMETFSETHRQMKKTVDEYYQAIERTERRIAEVTEMQRLTEDRFRQDWAAFLADDQKRWTTHMLLRDEQWREHDRQNAKQLERLEMLEEQMSDALEALRSLRAAEQSRFETLIGLMREWLAEYEQSFARVR